MLNYWCKWAIAIYGWKYHWLWTNLDLSNIINALWEPNDSNENILLNYVNIHKDDIIKVKWNSTLYHPAYIVAFDHKTKNIVISVRGTMSYNDIITYMNNNTVQFMNGKVHEGILKGARNIYNDIINKLIILTRNNKYKNYGLRFVGHSLGGAVVSVITYILFDNYDFMRSKTKTYTFGPPPIFSENIAEKWNNNITTFVNNKDLIPRLSIGEQLFLPGLILHFIKTKNRYKIISRKKEYFNANNVSDTSFSEHLPNRYIEITKKTNI